MSIVQLNQATNTKLYGGKASSLARMMQAGFFVPDGFVISLNHSQTISAEEHQQIASAFEALGSTLVAVRSSALAEDGTATSWAGQLETYLNVSYKQLLPKIELCRRSAHNHRARMYAEHNHQASGRVAVIVQAMVSSSASGVAFSVHPITQNSDHIAIEAVFGFGESLVSGEVTPDSYLISKKQQTILNKHIVLQEKQLARSETSANIWQDINAPDQKLSDKQIIELASVVMRIEHYFKHPVDIEWAYDNEQLVILQSRPITTLG